MRANIVTAQAVPRRIFWFTCSAGSVGVAMAAVVTEKSADELRREIEELNRQQREITERLRDPRGLRKAGAAGVGPRGAGVGPQRLFGRGLGQRGIVRRGDGISEEEQPPTKKRLLSAVVKVEGDEDAGDQEKTEAVEPQEEIEEEKKFDELREPRKPYLERGYGRGRRDFRGADRGSEQDIDTLDPLPRVLPKIDDPNVAKRNRRMFGALLGTLEKFRQEDKKLSGTEALMRRSASQKRAEQRAQEESERLRQQERELLAGKRKRDMILRARLAAKAEEKQLEVLFIQWSEHQTKLCSFLRTKAEPAIFWMPAKASEATDKLLESRQEELAEWKTQRRVELKEYQRLSTEQHLAKVEVDIARYKSGPQHGNANDVPSNTELEMEDHDATGDTERGQHGWRRGKVQKESDNGEDDQGEDGEEEEAKVETEIDAKDDSLAVEAKESEDGDNLDEKIAGGGGALKEVMDYGSGEEDMEEG